MFDDVILIHRLMERDPTPFIGADESNWVLWKTCIRHIAIGSAQNLACPLFVRKGDEVYGGVQAYRFFLEIVCGLHSPVLGETEVMGQFKDLVSKVDGLAKSNQNPVYAYVQKFLNSALTDTKEVRDTCLRDLGNRSYGSLLRRHVSGSESLNIIGAGKLVKEILPWLINKTPTTTVYCRKLEQGKNLKKDFSKLEVKKWPTLTGSKKGAWIIAAPLTSNQIYSALDKIKNIEHLIDLRDHSQSDPVDFKGISVLRLHEFFNQIAGTHKEVESKVVKAKDLITSLCFKRFRTMENRPFGWEDLCG